jgi:hypothetical protein
VRTSGIIKELIELSLFLELKGCKSGSLPLGKGPIQALRYEIKPFLQLKILED